MTDEGDTGAALPPEEHSLAEWLVSAYLTVGTLLIAVGALQAAGVV